MRIPDPYRWLEDQDSREVRSWIESQSRYADFLLAPLPEREAVERQVSELIRIEVASVPVQRAGRYFFLRRPSDRDRSAIFVRDGLDGADRLLVDPEALGKGTLVSLLDVSPDGLLLAYGIRDGGEDEIRVRFLDVESGRDLPDELPRARYNTVSLLPGRGGAYFARQGKEGGRVWHHPLGGQDEEVFGEGYGPDKIVLCNLSDDGRYLTLTVLYGSSSRRTEVYLRDLASPGPLKTVVKDLDAAFFAGMAGGRLVIHTTWNAPNGRILTADPERPDRSTWTEIVPERKDATIRSVRAVGGRVFVNYLEDVRSRVEGFRLDGSKAGEIAFDTLGTVTNVSGTWESHQAFVLFTSFHVPNTIYAYDAETGARKVWFRLAAPFESDRYQIEQVWYPSRDGTRVPMFLVYRKGLRRDGANPTLLNGYGGFGASMTPFYSALAAAWLQSGGIYAVASLRGGGELGESWHEAGMLANKQKTFDDFIAAAEWLIREGYTRPSRLAANGSSNGALTAAVAITQRPDLFRAAVLSYPLLDMVRYPRFLMGSLWVAEYGSPDDPKQLQWLYGYSPYHHVQPGRQYPAVLLISGDADTRVSPMHARKMTAALQQVSSEERPVVLRYHSRAGHATGQAASDQIEDTTDTLSFLEWQLGMREEGSRDRPPGTLTFDPHVLRTGSGTVEAELGRLTVPESRGSMRDSTVDLAFVRLRSTAAKPGPPIVFLAGGPGGSGIEAAQGSLAPLFQALRAVADVIALDQRGTGMSHPALVCHESWALPFDQPGTQEGLLRAAVEHSRACAAALRTEGIDLDAYNIEESADDLEDLRRALGVPKLDLLGMSYGSQLALTAMRRHGASLERVVLAGVLGPDQTLRLPQEVQGQLADIGRLVRADPRIAGTVPDLLALVKKVLDRLDREPVVAEVEDAIGKRTVEIRLGRFDLQWMTAERLGSREGIRSLPSLYLEMERGDFSGLAQFAFRNRKGWLGSAVPYVAQCAAGASEERLAQIRREEGETLLGSVPNLPFPGICQGWGVTSAGPELRSPVTSELPVLLISGSLDGRTPPAGAEEVRRGLSRAAHLILEGAAHGNDLLIASPEVTRAVLDFLRGEEIRSDRISLPPPVFEPAPIPAAGKEGG